MLEWQLGIRDIGDAHPILADLFEARGGLVTSPPEDSLFLVTFTAPPDLLIIDVTNAWLENLGLAGALITTRLAEDAPWLQGWRAIIHPHQVSDRIWLAPNWAALPEVPGAAWIRVGALHGFGGGGHPTTRLSLRFLDRALAARDAATTRVLDIGCGTGILTLAAARLGARVWGFDVNPSAVTVAHVNVALNGVADRVTLGVARVEDVAASVGYDLVVANLLYNLLKHHGGQVARLASDELIVSGFFPSQRDEILAALDGFEVIEESEERGWAALWLRRVRSSRSRLAAPG